MSNLSNAVKEAFRAVIGEPCLKQARALEKTLREENFERQVFGRINQKSSIEAASESDRGIVERLANAFDSSLTAARLASGIERSDKTLTPRNAAQKFFCARPELCDWTATDRRLNTINKPIVEFWTEPEDVQRFRKHRPSDGLATVLVQDSGTGIARDRMPKTILTLNSESKLKEFEAIGQFGHGGSSAFAFCESCLIISQPRFGGVPEEFYWTLIFTESEPEESKQNVIRRWFSATDGLPLVGRIEDFPKLREALPGTSVWHFGYNRGGWIKRIAGPEQTNPWGRLGRLFFSYPLPFEVRGEFARTDSPNPKRTIKGAFYRIIERSDESSGIEYRSGEKRERLIVDGVDYGEFSVHVFVFRDSGSVKNYLDSQHPVVLSLNGQNHGEMTRTLIANANLPEISSSAIVEVRLDSLEQEALSEIISNSREHPKNTTFTRALRDVVTNLLRDDDDLKALERRLEEDKARQSSADLSRKMSEFLSRILSDAVGGGDGGSGLAPGERPEHVSPPHPRPPVPSNDPPTILEFLRETPLFVAEGTRARAKFRSDARPPKYSFHGDNPRLFARLETAGEMASRLTLVGRADISEMGYGSVSLSCEPGTTPITEETTVGELVLTLQSVDGRILETRSRVGVRPKPEQRERAARHDVHTEIVFCAPDSVDRNAIAALIGEPAVRDFGTGLRKLGEVLTLNQPDCSYWGEKSERDGVAFLSIEINAGNPNFQALINHSRDVSERIAAKERYVRDIVLDCYQHSFQLQSTPETVRDRIQDDPNESRRAADIHLNHDKAIRIAIHEMNAAR
jgi:hypothetical protein